MPGKLTVQSSASSQDYIPRTLNQGICCAGKVQTLLHDVLAGCQGWRCSGCFSSVLFCGITNSWYLFQAGFWFICVSCSDAVLAAGVPTLSSGPPERPPCALQKHDAEHNLSTQLTFTDIPSGMVQLGKEEALIPFPTAVTLLEVGAAEAVSSTVLLGHRSELTNPDCGEQLGLSLTSYTEERRETSAYKGNQAFFESMSPNC